LVAWNSGRVDVIDTRANLVGITKLLESREEFHVTFRGLDGNDIGIETLDGGEDVIEVGIAEVRVRLEFIGNSSCGKLERVDCPLQVSVPVRATKGKPFSNSGLIDLDGMNTGLL